MAVAFGLRIPGKSCENEEMQVKQCARHRLAAALAALFRLQGTDNANVPMAMRMYQSSVVCDCIACGHGALDAQPVQKLDRRYMLTAWHSAGPPRSCAVLAPEREPAAGLQRAEPSCLARLAAAPPQPERQQRSALL